ncbi:MAG: hypothetical protein GX595_05355 [Lentisphaerae bacterium]|nr:hypothetical protein [Lentisphaerota bacterium]
MARLATLCALSALTAWLAAATAAEPVVTPIASPDDWLRWVIPLPKEASLPTQVTLDASAVRLVLDPGAGPSAGTGFRQLQALFREKAGIDGSTGDIFEIRLGRCDEAGRIGDEAIPGAERLRELPNRDQAYVIRAVGERRIVLAALESPGLLYAAQTLRQLLEPRFRGAMVTLPLLTVTDWPDLAERGEWGGSSMRDIEWLAERRMNLVEFHTEHRVTADGQPVATVDSALLRRGELHAVHMVPIISHLNGMGQRGVYEAFPELRGKGSAAVYKTPTADLVAPCASQPRLVEVLAGWMRALAATASVRDISCWLGELRQHCDCEACRQTGQFALEARAFVAAWRLARQTVPDLRIRVLLTQGSYDSNDRVLAEIPPEVGVTYYDGGRTYDSSPQPMIYPLLEDYAANGGWLGCYPQLTPSWRIVSPWSCPHFIRFRLTEFVDKRLSCLAGYVVPDNRLFDVQVSAAAEWSWNAHGRDERAFMTAWATRQGFDRPDAVATWATTLGPAAWDLYGARFVERYLFHPQSLASLLTTRQALPYGQAFLAQIPDAARLHANRDACAAALTLALEVGSPAMVAESRAVLAYYDMVIALGRLCDVLADNRTPASERRDALQEHLNRLALAGCQNQDALRDWERAVAVGSGGGRLRESIEATAGTVHALAKALAPHGLRNPAPMVMGQPIGGWSSEDFRESAAIVREWEVTPFLVAPGTYEVTFQYSSGWNGLQTSRAALVSWPRDGADAARVEVSADAHPGTTGHRSSGNVYTLVLSSLDPDRRYAVVAEIRGTRPQDQPAGRTGCSGTVTLQRRREHDWQIRLLELRPDERAAGPDSLKTAFTGKGLRVGVVVGGYGSESLRECLQAQPGLDVVALSYADLRLDECQVVVWPQSRSSAVPPDLVAALESYVANGGGLVATHDAVGYRQMPKLLTALCQGGTAHVRDERWRCAADHPVTAGLDPKATLAQSYLDHVQIEPGPAGKVVAVAEKTGRPVVVAGDHGKGRYVACGLLPGCSADAQEAPPTADETRLLTNAVRWCARAPQDPPAP